MNKESYTSRPTVIHRPTLDRSKTISTPGSYDSTSEDGMPEGSRGLSMPLESLQIPLYRDNEDRESAEAPSDGGNHEIKNLNNLSKLLVELSDNLDKFSKHKLADFADFLLIKIAEGGTKDYERLFRLAIINIANSDIVNSGKLVSAAVEKYSNMISSGLKDEEAYNASLEVLFSSQDMLSKHAQILEMNPSYVADQLHKIIKIMLAKISPEKRSGSFKNVANKLSDFNVLEISNKKAPGGAAIGASLGLVKNVLNSKDSYFVNVVLKELIKRL
jgi:hypothetical protein